MKKAVNNEPHWCQMFNFAERIVTDGDINTHGRELVLEMLQYGKRLNQHYVCVICESEVN